MVRLRRVRQSPNGNSDIVWRLVPVEELSGVLLHHFGCFGRIARLTLTRSPCTLYQKVLFITQQAGLVRSSRFPPMRLRMSRPVSLVVAATVVGHQRATTPDRQQRQAGHRRGRAPRGGVQGPLPQSARLVDVHVGGQVRIELPVAGPIRAEVHGRPHDAVSPRPALCAHRGRPTAFAGRYESDELRAVLQITPGKDALMSRLNDSPASVLEFRPVDRDTFQRGLITVRFVRDTAGTVVGFNFSNPVLRKVEFTRRRNR